MNRFFLTLFVIVAVLMFLYGCASNSYDVARGDAVPASELGARGAQFAGQAQQFHQSAMGIDLCPQGTAEKSGGGSVNSGAGDKNGVVTYNVTTQSVAKTKCDFGAMNPVPSVKATKAAPAPLAPPTGLTATQEADNQSTKSVAAAKADKSATKATKPSAPAAKPATKPATAVLNGDAPAAAPPSVKKP